MQSYRLTIYDVEKEKLGRSVLFSLLTHVVILSVFFVLPSVLRKGQPLWGDPGAGGGGAISVGIVSSMSGLSLPKPAITTANTVATDSKGLGKTEVAKKESAPPVEPSDPKAFEIEHKKAPTGPPKPVRVSHRPEDMAKTEPSPVVPFGEGGAPNFNYTQFSTGSGVGGLGLGDGVFGERYGWYVRQIRDTVSSNWQRSMIDPQIRSAPRVSVQFEILRDGSVGNNSVKQSSGIPSLDRSAMRAVAASHFPPLPGGETHLVVEFWFEYSR
jgi:periplasmic protein TonB